MNDPATRLPASEEPSSQAASEQERSPAPAPPFTPIQRPQRANDRPPKPGNPVQQVADAAVHGVLARHWNTLGIPPTMDLAELEASYYLIVERFPRNPTEEEESQRLEMNQAYAVLRRALEERVEVSRPYREVSAGLSARQRATLLGVAVLGLAVLVYLNIGTLKLEWAEYRPGTVIRLATKQEPYATVLRFDPSHKFAVGPATRAYQLKLAGNGDVVWLSERVVEKGMVPVK